MAAVPRAHRPMNLRVVADYADTSELYRRHPGKDDWKDEEILGYPGVRLEVLSNEQMNEECLIFLYGVQNNLTPRAVGAAILLVWNMRSTEPIEERIFPEDDPGFDIHDKTVEDLREENAEIIDEETRVIFERCQGFEGRRAVAFLAASTFKMFSKSPDSWYLAWNNSHIQDRYRDFTKKTFPITDWTPNRDQIELLYDAYQGQKIFLGSLGRILYSIADLDDKRQAEMLFEQHLACTGLHIIPQFINARNALSAKTSDLLSAIDMGQNKDTLLQLKGLIDTSLSFPIDNYNRATWRFSRLFSPDAFGYLQTKYCQDTVAVLAQINNIASATTPTSNPLHIAVLRQMGPMRLRNLRIAAQNIYNYFTITARAMENPFFGIDPDVQIPVELEEEDDDDDSD